MKLNSYLLSMVLLSISIRSEASSSGLIQDGAGYVFSSSMIASISKYSVQFSIVLLVILCLKLFAGKSKCYIGWLQIFYFFFSITFAFRTIESMAPAKFLLTIFANLMLLVCSGALPLQTGNPNLGIWWIISAIEKYSYTAIGMSCLMALDGIGYRGTRFTGISFHPNQMGQIAAIGSLVAVSRVLDSESRNKIFHLVMLFSSSFVMLISASRGAIVSALAGIMYLLCRNRSLRKVGVSMYLWGALVLMAVYVFILNFASLDIITRLTSTNDNRSDVWAGLIHDFLESPFFGKGMDAIGSENALLKSLAITGIIGGFWIFMVYMSVLRILMIKNNCNNVLPKSMIILVLVGSLFDGYLVEYFGISAVLVLLLGVGIECSSKGLKQCELRTV